MRPHPVPPPTPKGCMLHACLARQLAPHACGHVSGATACCAAYELDMSSVFLPVLDTFSTTTSGVTLPRTTTVCFSKLTS